MYKIKLLLPLWIGFFLVALGPVSVQAETAPQIVEELKSCFSECISGCGTSLTCLAGCKSCGDGIREKVEDMDKCEGFVVPVVSAAINAAAEKFACAGISKAFDVACMATTSPETEGGTVPVCVIGGEVLDFTCAFKGTDYTRKMARNISRSICDYAFPDEDPYIIVTNNLESQKVDFSAIVNAGPDVHLRGNNWLEPGETGVLASHSLNKDGFTHRVHARVKRDWKADKTLDLYHVYARKHHVYVSYSHGYHIYKKEERVSPTIAVENHLKSHKVDFRAVIHNSPDVHLPGSNWLDPGKDAILGSYKLLGASYTVKARIKRDNKSDITLTIKHVHPGEDMVYVYHSDGKYHIRKKSVGKSSNSVSSEMDQPLMAAAPPQVNPDAADQADGNVTELPVEEEPGYEAGYAAGYAAAMDEFQKGADWSCGNYDAATKILHVPCVELDGKDYWLDLRLEHAAMSCSIPSVGDQAGSDIMKGANFELMDSGENEIDPEKCESFSRDECFEHPDVCAWEETVTPDSVTGRCVKRSQAN